MTPQEQDLMARTVLAEARGEGPAGMAAVAQVILNRAGEQGPWPSSIAGVIGQPGAFAKPLSNYSYGEYQQAMQIVSGVADGSMQVPAAAQNATYFANPRTSDPAALRQITSAASDMGAVGNHRFYGNPQLNITPNAPAGSATPGWSQLQGASTPQPQLNINQPPTANPNSGIGSLLTSMGITPYAPGEQHIAGQLGAQYMGNIADANQPMTSDVMPSATELQNKLPSAAEAFRNKLASTMGYPNVGQIPAVVADTAKYDPLSSAYVAGTPGWSALQGPQSNPPVLGAQSVRQVNGPPAPSQSDLAQFAAINPASAFNPAE